MSNRVNLEEVVLEPSSNTHKLTGNIVNVENFDNSVMKVNLNGDGLISHGEHGTFKTESPSFIKTVQRELNPVTKAFQAVYD